ncbi:hypothetical protein E3P92_02579 [Wallemia ichthyophaga]|uniref:Programmed cell death protein 5 n=1 Tax=Wallemia ichthyophaga TaxID=245174 RepID=A0A4T0GBU6_WALIC|nr:hypothetical protein E3P91_03002 [Wallemia ichthyophaga]TIA81057.1 hypothetical protein E3P98_02335 [Wallemia ichthyophaga]TIA90262.1 hypothetical protein E3P97_02657 [Wallemia ichthyophaga]TIA98845.1 hypothetical protein E3P95_02301 [Wallemia ichthyophaga]TIB00046.1 hypothetical protein E3P94_02358 [Wallemia ichthyophaga]
MGDQELEAIRQSRLQQLKQQGGGGSGGKDPEAASANDEAKHMDLARILEPQARERCLQVSRIALVKPEHSERIKDMLIKMAKSGQIRSQVTEQQLVGLLDQVSSVVPSASASKITFNRKQVIDDEDDFDL